MEDPVSKKEFPTYQFAWKEGDPGEEYTCLADTRAAALDNAGGGPAYIATYQLVKVEYLQAKKSTRIVTVKEPEVDA
jgi:hypothetical protein